MSIGQVAALRRPGAKPLLQTGPYSVSEDLIRKAKSGSPDTPEFGSRTDPASNLQLAARCVYAIKNLGLETVADVDSCSDLNLLKQYGISRVRSEEHTSELQSLMRISYAVFCLKNKKTIYQLANDNESKKTKKHSTHISIT